VIVEDGDGELVLARVLPTFSTGLSSGVGRQDQQADVVRHDEIVGEMPPAPSRTRIACAWGATWLAISASWSDSISALARGRTREAVARRAGQTAPKM
jgi:hypothetical protein